MSDIKLNQTRLTYKEAKSKGVGKYFIVVSSESAGKERRSSAFSNVHFVDLNNGDSTFTCIGFK